MQNNMFEEKEMGVVTSGAEKIPQADMDKTVGKAFYSVEEIAVLMGISRSKAYVFVTSDDCTFSVIKLGKRYLIPIKAFNAWVDSLV